MCAAKAHIDGRIVLKKRRDNMSCLRGPQNRGAEKVLSLQLSALPFFHQQPEVSVLGSNIKDPVTFVFHASGHIDDGFSIVQQDLDSFAGFDLDESELRPHEIHGTADAEKVEDVAVLFGRRLPSSFLSLRPRLLPEDLRKGLVNADSVKGVAEALLLFPWAR